MSPTGIPLTFEERARQVRVGVALKARRDGTLGPEEALLAVLDPPPKFREITDAIAKQRAERSRRPFVRLCRGCKQPFKPQNKTSIYCSTNCRQEHCHKKAQEVSTHCRNGHPRTPENTSVRGDGFIRCLECQRQRDGRRAPEHRKQQKRESGRRYYARNRERLIKERGERKRRARAARTATPAPLKTQSSSSGKGASRPARSAERAGERPSVDTRSE